MNTPDTQSSPTIFSRVYFKEDKCPLIADDAFLRLLIVTELSLSNMVVVCCVLRCSVCSFLNKFLTNLPLHSQNVSHILRDILVALNSIEKRIPEEEIVTSQKEPYWHGTLRLVHVGE